MWHRCDMETVRDIVAALGQKAVAEALGVGRTAVGNAVSRGRFPAAWYSVITKMCEARGMAAAPDLFGMVPQARAESAPPVAAEDAA